MKTRLKIYALIAAMAALYIGWHCLPAHGAEAEIPVTVTVINCLDPEPDPRCAELLGQIEPAGGEQQAEDENKLEVEIYE